MSQGKSPKSPKRGKSPSRIPVFTSSSSSSSAQRKRPARVLDGKDESPRKFQAASPASSTASPMKTPMTGFQRLQFLAKEEVRNKEQQRNQWQGSSDSAAGRATKGVLPWADKHVPKSLEELFVHKKKVEEVQHWLMRTLDGNKQKTSPSKARRICVFSGPAGSGKTATIHLVGKQLDFEVKEWSNPMALTQFRSADYEGSKDDIQGRSQLDIFVDFLFRTSQYKSLPMKGKAERKHRLIVVEDIPHNFYKDTNQFHEILRNYNKMGQAPLVFIISDSSSSDHSMYKIFPKQILLDLNICNISFNPVAATLMTKFLMEICSRESIPVDKSSVEEIAATANGDLRCAINNLQFSLTRERGHNATRKDMFKKPPARKTKQPKGNKSSEGSEFQQKDTTIQLFRALGKVLYAKRDESTTKETEMELVGEMEPERRMHPLLENPENICDKVEVSADTFVGFLHQNYPVFYGSIDDMRTAAEYLGLSDFILNAWKFDDSGTGSSYKTRQVKDLVGMNVAVRGLMHSNNHRLSCGFKPLTKPTVSNMDSLLKDSVESTRQALFHLRELQTTLFTETIPFHAKLLSKPSYSNQSCGRKEILEKGIFVNKSVKLVNLDEKESVVEVGEAPDEDAPEAGNSQKTEYKVEIEKKFVDENVSQEKYDDDEEFVIEEYDDDD